MKEDIQTMNLTLRDIHVGDWVQVESYSSPLKIIQICDDGTIYLVTSDKKRHVPRKENIKNVNALPITKDLLKGFGFDLSELTECYGCYMYISVYYKGVYVGELRYIDDNKVYLQVYRDACEYMHELIEHSYRHNISVNFEWKGVKNEREI